MKENSFDRKQNVAILPYVSVETRLSIGEYELWPNSREMWIEVVGADYSALTNPYKNSRGAPVGTQGSLLTRKDRERSSFSQFRDVVVALSTASWIGGGRASDSWVFEAWPLPKSGNLDEPFARHGKFSVNITSPRQDRFYPTVYMRPISIDHERIAKVLPWFANELAKPKGESSIIALSHFHRARYETHYFSLPVDDVETLWSGFESFFHFPYPWRQELGGRAEHLIECVRRDLNGLSLSPEFWAGLKQWVFRAYEVRCRHTHGDDAPDSLLELEEHRIPLLDFGLLLAESLIEMRAAPVSLRDYVYWRIQRTLGQCFDWKVVIDRILRILKGVNRKALYPSKGVPGAEGKVSEIESLLRRMNSFQSVFSDYANVENVAQARKTVGLAISAWFEELEKSQLPGLNYFKIRPVREIISRGMESGLGVKEIDEKLARYFSAAVMYREESYYSDFSEAVDSPVLAVGEMTPWKLVDLFVWLHELFIGYSLRRNEIQRRR